MADSKKSLGYSEPVEIAEGIHWVGFSDREEGLHCNPYLVRDGDEAVLIDGGSRPHFSTVMMKILETGLKPAMIRRLIYQHYDPDLCGSIPNFEEVIGSDDLKIISHKENNVFIRYYATVAPRLCMEEIGNEFAFSSGRCLRFIRTPYSHSAGSFVTFDEHTGTLFSSDLFGSYGMDWDLFLDLPSGCIGCPAYDDCPMGLSRCPVKGMYSFHARIMTSCKALRLAMRIVQELAPAIVAPQHGSVIRTRSDIETMTERLSKLERVGIDAYD